MIATSIRTEMVLHRGLGVGYSQIIKQFVSTIFSCPEHHIEVHHIIHDGIMWPVARLHFSRPAQYRTNNRIEECGKRIGRSQDYVLVFLRMIHLVALAIRAEHQETDIVVVARTIGDAFQRFRISFGSLAHSLILGILIVHPEDAWPETITPLFRCSLAAIPSLLLIPLQDIARFHRIIERTILLLQLSQGTLHLLVAVLQLLINIECRNLSSSLYLLRHAYLRYGNSSHTKKYSSYFHRLCFISNTNRTRRILKIKVEKLTINI